MSEYIEYDYRLIVVDDPDRGEAGLRNVPLGRCKPEYAEQRARDFLQGGVQMVHIQYRGVPPWHTEKTVRT